jgi:hypothetical protein
MNHFKFPIAMTDLETSGDIPGVHEILEIGLVLFEQSSGNILDKWEIKIRPEHIENAVPAAIERNGYDPKKWENAISLPEAIQIYGEKTQNLIRVEDVVAELEPRLKSLRRQAKRMEAREQLETELRVLLREYWGSEHHALSTKLKACVSKRCGINITPQRSSRSTGSGTEYGIHQDGTKNTRKLRSFLVFFVPS